MDDGICPEPNREDDLHYRMQCYRAGLEETLRILKEKWEFETTGGRVSCVFRVEACIAICHNALNGFDESDE